MVRTISLNVASLWAILVPLTSFAPCLHGTQVSVPPPSSASLRATVLSTEKSASDRQAVLDEQLLGAFRRVELVNGSIALRTLTRTQFGDKAAAKYAGVCGSSMDYAFIADVSGSVEQTGVDATKQFLGHLSCRLRFGDAEGFQKATTIEAGMKAELLNHPLAGNKKDFLEGVEKLTWEQGAMNLAEALGTAQSAFMYGRQFARSLILVIADGPGLSQRAAKQMAAKVSQSADLVVLLVADAYDETARRAATEWLQAAHSCTPYGCRMIQVSSYSALAAADVTPVLAEVCRDLI